MFSIQQTVKEHIAYNEGYSKGQEDAHRYYHMMFTGKQELQNSGGEPMNGKQEQDFLGEYVNQGCYMNEYDDHIVTVCHKDKEIAAFNATTVTAEEVQAALKRYFAQLATPTGAAQ